jgi:hypothetical protein
MRTQICVVFALAWMLSYLFSSKGDFLIIASIWAAAALLAGGD